MSFRTRLALVSAAAVGLAVVFASVAVFLVVRDQLFGQVDRALHDRGEEIASLPVLRLDSNGNLDIPGPGFGRERDYVRAVPRAGPPVQTPDYNGDFPIPVTTRDRTAAAGGRGIYYSTRDVRGTQFRVLTISSTPFAIQIARSLTEVNRTLHRITIFLILIAIAGIAVAAALGLLVARAALAPVRRLTETTESVTETRDLSQRIESTSEDELGRLASSFNTMLAALEESDRAQRQLVADASHELRTPLTSLRTNIEVLARGNKLPQAEREQLLDDVVEQIGEMTVLIAELMELARGERQEERPEDVRLDLIAAEAVESARRNRPNIEFSTDFEETFVHGAPSTIERAVANLLDNAAKWSAPGGEVEVEVRDGEVTVRDHGPGIEDEDLPYIFDRFYRARSARGQPGSGLGLAIVKQIADTHGGQVVAERAEDGGTVMRLRLNGRSSS
jgi:two-component system, OmpR family, sensor histidine kinase MprB